MNRVPSWSASAARRAALRDELARRAEWHLRQTHLTVDYYRIRRRLAYPLPLSSLPVPGLPVRGLPHYPWATWLSWALEERIGALGWAGHWLRRRAWREAAQRDLAALARWPSFRAEQPFDLCQAHTTRALCTALIRWPWLGRSVQRRIRRALARSIEEEWPTVDAYWARFQTADPILADAEPHRILRNIPLIVTTALALAANTAAHRAAAALNRQVGTAADALFRLRAQGHSEAVAYDGYILDFLASWCAGLPDDQQRRLLRRPEWNGFFEASYRLAAPGAMVEVAELHDVEARRMPFHIAAHAKTYRLHPTATLAWYLNRCPLDRLHADGLAALHDAAVRGRGRAPEPGALDAHYAVALRTGWEAADVAAVVGVTRSPAHHIHCANGGVLIGTRRHWFIVTPGYQQYLPTSEREFTLGVTAQNTPVINGHAQTTKSVRRLALETEARDRYRTTLDLTACYPAELGLKHVHRTVWLADRRTVVVADRLVGRAIESLGYYWHGHPDAAWWVQDGWARLYLAETTLWFTSPQIPLTDALVQRRRGSRGQLTLCASAPARPCPVVWWVFAFGARPPMIRCGAGARTLVVARARFRT